MNKWRLSWCPTAARLLDNSSWLHQNIQNRCQFLSSFRSARNADSFDGLEDPVEDESAFELSHYNPSRISSNKFRSSPRKSNNSRFARDPRRSSYRDANAKGYFRGLDSDDRRSAGSVPRWIGRDMDSQFSYSGEFGGRQNETFGSELKDIEWSKNKETLDLLRKAITFSSSSSPTILDDETSQEYLVQNSITISGEGVQKPCFDFKTLSALTDTLEDAVVKLEREFPGPLPIQSVCWPAALSGSNLVGVGQTGSGKTLAYALPAIAHVRSQEIPLRKGVDGPLALILAPTRELAFQIKTVLDEYSGGLRVACLHGGSNKFHQIDALERGVHIAVATPGRLIDLLLSGVTNLRRAGFVVFDEADRMFDMGFHWQIRKIMGQCRPDRQVLMWTATWPREIQDLVKDYLAKHVHVVVGSKNLRPNPNISHQFESLESERDKQASLLSAVNRLWKEDKDGKILVFASTKAKCHHIRVSLNRLRVQCLDLHSDKTQRQREFILNQFRNGRTNMLIATDIAARGLDIDDVTAVINYDAPQTVEDYVHRVGRTGRVNKKGRALTFLTTQDGRIAQDLIAALKEAGSEVPDVVVNLRRKWVKQQHDSRRRRRSFDL